MWLTYDPETDIATLYLFHSEHPLARGAEISPGVILHFNERAQLAQIELLGASERYPQQYLLQYSVSEPVKISEGEQVNWAFQVVISDPEFRPEASLKAPALDLEAKKFIVALYERLTGRKLLPS